MDENTTSTTVEDVYGTNDGVLEGNSNTQAVSRTGMIKRAFEFDGTDDAINLGDNSVFEFGNKPFTIEAWINQDTRPSVDGDNHIIFSKFKTTGDQREFRFYVNLLTDTLAFSTTTNGATSTQTVINANTNLSINTWYHVAVTKSGTTATFYLNGVADGSGTVATTIFSGTAEARIGVTENDGITTSGQFDGLIDNVKVYNRSLSASEITALYNYRSRSYTVSVTASNGTSTDVQTLPVVVN